VECAHPSSWIVGMTALSRLQPACTARLLSPSRGRSCGSALATATKPASAMLKVFKENCIVAVEVDVAVVVVVVVVEVVVVVVEGCGGWVQEAVRN